MTKKLKATPSTTAKTATGIRSNSKGRSDAAASRAPARAKATAPVQAVEARPSHIPHTAHRDRDDDRAFIPNPERTHRRVADDFAEYFGETFVQAATGNDVDADDGDAVLPEEVGGPFIETDAVTQFGSTMATAAEFEDEPTLPEAFPTAVRADAEPVLQLEDPARDPEQLLSDADDDLNGYGELVDLTEDVEEELPAASLNVTRRRHVEAHGPRR